MKRQSPILIMAKASPSISERGRGFARLIVQLAKEGWGVAPSLSPAESFTLRRKCFMDKAMLVGGDDGRGRWA